MKPEERLYNDLQHSETRNDISTWVSLAASIILSTNQEFLAAAVSLMFAIVFYVLSVKTAKLRKRLVDLSEEEAAP